MHINFKKLDFLFLNIFFCCFTAETIQLLSVLFLEIYFAPFPLK